MNHWDNFEAPEQKPTSSQADLPWLERYRNPGIYIGPTIEVIGGAIAVYPPDMYPLPANPEDRLAVLAIRAKEVTEEALSRLELRKAQTEALVAEALRLVRGAIGVANDSPVSARQLELAGSPLWQTKAAQALGHGSLQHTGTS